MTSKCITKSGFMIMMILCIMSFKVYSQENNFNKPSFPTTKTNNISFTRGTQSLGNSVSFGIGVADFDMDGDYDLVTHDLINGTKLYINDGAGHYTLAGSLFGSSVFYCVAYEKFDADDDYDLIFSKENGAEIFFNDFSITGINETDNSKGNNFNLKNYPNPFKDVTTISYSLQTPDNVCLQVLNLSGKILETLVNIEQNLGNHELLFKPNNLPNGIYYYRINTPEFSETSTMIICK